jgi:drug/metabolite transporter (DMT)-like permease
VLALATAAGAAFLLPAALVGGGAFWPQDWRPVVALAVSSQLAGQGLMVYASGRLPASTLALGLLVQPLVSAAAGIALLGDRLGPAEIAGAVLISLALLRIRR